MTKRKFYKQRITVTVLSEEPATFNDLADLAEALANGPCVGTVEDGRRTHLNGRQAARALYAVGSEPGFFRLTDDGNDAA